MSEIDIRFAGEGPHLEFVECGVKGKSVRIGEWVRDGEYRLLRISPQNIEDAQPTGIERSITELEEIVEAANAERQRIYTEFKWEWPKPFSIGDVRTILEAARRKS